jgi:hypothetical protein
VLGAEAVDFLANPGFEGEAFDALEDIGQHRPFLLVDDAVLERQLLEHGQLFGVDDHVVGERLQEGVLN